MSARKDGELTYDEVTKWAFIIVDDHTYPLGEFPTKAEALAEGRKYLERLRRLKQRLPSQD